MRVQLKKKVFGRSLLALLAIAIALPSMAHNRVPSITQAPAFDRYEIADRQQDERELVVIDQATLRHFDDVSRIELPAEPIASQLETAIRSITLTAERASIDVFPVSQKLASGSLELFDENNLNEHRELGLKTRWALGNVRARWYDPSTGTFLTPDPMGYADSSNLYAFAGGDPVNGRDPTGQLTKSQLASIIGTFSRGDKGSFGEVALEKLLKRHGRVILEGPSNGKSVFKGGADIIAVSPDGRIEIWDNKFFTSTDMVTSVPTFTKPDRMAANLDRARELVLNSSLPNKVQLLAKIAAKDVDWLVGGAGAFNRVKRIASTLAAKGIKFGNRAYIKKTGRVSGRAGAKRAGKVAVAAIPFASLALYAPELRAAVAEDRFFADMVGQCGDCGELPFELANANLLETLGAALGEEVGGELGCMGGGTLAGLAGLPSGPGAIATGLGGCVAGGAAGDYLGGMLGRELVQGVLTWLAE